MINQVNSREIVLDMLLEILEDEKFSHMVIHHTLSNYQQLQKIDRAFISRICTGTVERYLTLDYVINQFSTVQAIKMKPLIRNLLRLSVYQILYMDQVPVSAVCNEAVKLAKKRGFAKLSGFVNGVLRNIARQKEQISFPSKIENEMRYLEILYSVPEWLVKELLEQYDFDTVEAMLSASLMEKETTIRCNKRKITPEKLKETLIHERVAVEDSEYLDYAFVIKNFDYLEKLPSFQEGLFTVQDISSMLVSHTAAIQQSDFVVDVCAAPGGKALHAAETADKVSARDITERKISLIKENVKRMGLNNVKTKVWDATVKEPELFCKADVVIADLPCSGLGVLGKKSDIKYRLSKKQLSELVELQRRILGVVQNYVKEGGILIYSTCTVNREENINNRNWFLNNYDFIPESLDPYLPDILKDEHTKEGYLQLVQGVHRTDGFFIARLRKKRQ